VAFDRVKALSPAPIFEAIQAVDPTLVEAAIEIEDTGPFRNRDGGREALLTLWCGEAEGRTDGSIAVVARRPRKSRPIVVVELALGWEAVRSERQGWLLSECRRVRP
jgi:hypothetical protein